MHLFSRKIHMLLQSTICQKMKIMAHKLFCTSASSKLLQKHHAYVPQEAVLKNVISSMDVPLNPYRWWLSYVNNQWHKWFQRHRILYVPLKIASLWLNGSTVRHHWRILENGIKKMCKWFLLFIFHFFLITSDKTQPIHSGEGIFQC